MYLILTFNQISLIFVISFVQQISGWFFQPTELERGRFEEAVKLKAEMKKLSMVDDFAAYSKIQRRLNLVTLGLETDGKSQKVLANYYN